MMIHFTEREGMKSAAVLIVGAALVAMLGLTTTYGPGSDGDVKVGAPLCWGCASRRPNSSPAGGLCGLYGRHAGELQLHGVSSPTTFYWSSTTFRCTPGYAWGVYFDVGFVPDRGVKSVTADVRAVRGGV